jgi:hypothetical protein
METLPLKWCLDSVCIIGCLLNKISFLTSNQQTITPITMSAKGENIDINFEHQLLYF